MAHQDEKALRWLREAKQKAEKENDTETLKDVTTLLQKLENDTSSGDS